MHYVCQVPREMLKQLVNVNVLENNVWSLLLHKINKIFDKNLLKMWNNILLPFNSQRQSVPLY